MGSDYLEKLKDPRWQKKRLEVFERDGWKCLACDDKDDTLNVHHLIYSKGEPWDAPMETLETLCATCHDEREQFNSLFRRGMFPTKLCLEFLDLFSQIFSRKKADYGGLLYASWIWRSLAERAYRKANPKPENNVAELDAIQTKHLPKAKV